MFDGRAKFKAASEMSRRVPAHAILIAEGLSVALGGTEIFTRVSLHVRQGETLFITGASGTHAPGRPRLRVSFKDALLFGFLTVMHVPSSLFFCRLREIYSSQGHWFIVASSTRSGPVEFGYAVLRSFEYL